MSLMGRLFIENRPSLLVIQKIVTNAWERRKKVQVLEAEMGLLQFLFDDAEDMEWVLKCMPWPVKDRVCNSSAGHQLRRRCLTPSDLRLSGFRCGGSPPTAAFVSSLSSG
ncbi:unnamed protein product [Linum trigynum]|uniref:DUF4283 domain-containing protein n=1 Tax=Linum trigynum TaxID=586398 RepID=A0AAV2G756_9ROSI